MPGRLSPQYATPRFLTLSKSDRSCGILLVTDGHRAYRAFAREAGIAHRAVNLSAGVRVAGALHVQNVNAYHGRFKQWLRRFHSVASHYLPNYLGWRWAVAGGRIASPEMLLRSAVRAFPHLAVT